MKKIFGVAAILGALILGAPAARAADLQPIYAIKYEKTVAAGAIITSPVLELDSCSTVRVLADNSLGGSTRTLNVDWLMADGTTILFRQAVTLLTTVRANVVITERASSATAGTNVTVIPAGPTPRMQFTLTAAGAAAGSLAVYCR